MSAEAALWRVTVGDGARLAYGPADRGPRELVEPGHTLAGSLAAGADLGQLPVAGPVPSGARPLVPVDGQPVWAAGVTFERSRGARVAESADTADIYERVYDAERPELFLKAAAGEARGAGEPITIRDDSGWDVPEPELGVVADSAGRAAGYVLGNDVSSRSIEGENPLYLPQAKVWEGSCAIGPCIVPTRSAPSLAEMSISLTVRRGGEPAFSDTVELARMRRAVDELLSWLFRAKRFPHGAVLLTGTSIVPGDGFTLVPGDQVEIVATGMGSLSNTVRPVSTELPA